MYVFLFLIQQLETGHLLVFQWPVQTKGKIWVWRTTETTISYYLPFSASHRETFWLSLVGVFSFNVTRDGRFFSLKVNADITRLEEGWHYNTCCCTNKVKKGFLVFGVTMSDPSRGLPILLQVKTVKLWNVLGFFFSCFFVFFMGLYNLKWYIYCVFYYSSYVWLITGGTDSLRTTSIALGHYRDMKMDCSFWNESGLSKRIIH